MQRFDDRNKKFLFYGADVILLIDLINRVINDFISWLLDSSYVILNKMVSNLTLLTLGWLTIGLLYCFLYKKFHQRLPGSTNFAKGMFLSLCFFFIPFILLIIIGLITTNLTFSIRNVTSIVINLLQWILIGYLISKLWDRYYKSQTVNV